MRLTQIIIKKLFETVNNLPCLLYRDFILISTKNKEYGIINSSKSIDRVALRQNAVSS